MKIIHKIKITIRAIIVLALVIYGIYFAVINKQLVAFDLGFIEFEAINLGLLVVISLFLGMLLGILAGAIAGYMPSGKK